jgi:chaperonin GroEL
VARRLALLIANQDFLEESGLQPLRGPANDIAALARVLQNPSLGNFEVSKFVDKAHHEVTRAIVETLQSAAAEDFVLIYYSGHGKTSVSGRLYLATADTTQRAFQATAVSAWSLHEAVSESACREVVLLLDCCYSGAVSQGLRSAIESQLQAVQNAAGFFILTASTSIQTASENEVEQSGTIMGRFTAAIVEGIESGKADTSGLGEIRLTDLKGYVERSLRGQTPQFFAHAGSGDPLISYGSRPGLDQNALRDLTDEAWYRRLGAVKYLMGVMEKGGTRESQAARAALSARRAVERDIDVRQAIEDALRLEDVSSPTVTRDKMLRGVNTLANAVKVTLGPKGRTLVIGRSEGKLRSTKSGVSVAKQIVLTDSFEDLGAQLIREVASNTNDKVGDGSTTAVVLAQAIVAEGMRAVVAGKDPQDVRRGIDSAAASIVEEIRASSKKIATKDEITQVATLTANGNRDLGELIAKAMEKVGTDGAITIEKSNSANTEVDTTSGIRFDRGYISPYFVTNGEKMITELENPYILLHEKKLSGLQAMLPVLEAVVQSGRPLLIIAEDVEGEALSTLVVNKLRGGLKVAAVKAPGFGDRRKAMLEDIAILTSGQVISEGLGIKLENVTLDMLGQAEKVRLTKDVTIIVAGGGKKVDIEGRTSQIRTQIEETTSDYDRERLQGRLAKIAGGVAVIRVGGATEVEMNDRIDRLEHALNATRAAVAEGVVPGGGVALLNASKVLNGFTLENEDQGAGVEILRRACQAPIRQIAENAGVEGSVVVARVLDSNSSTLGFNATTKQYEDLIHAGILDPAQVIRTALQEACSAAGLMITTDSAIIEVAQKATGSTESKQPADKQDEFSSGF